MPTIIQELQRILKKQKAQGIDCAWISPENMKAFYALSPLTRTAPQPPQASPRSNLQPPASQPIQQRPMGGGARSHPQQPHRNVVSRFELRPQEPPKQIQLVQLPNVAAMDWDELTRTAMNCRGCQLCAGRQHVVFGEGCRNARLMFIGEGPGADEDQQGIPFVGRAGQLLTRMILAMGLDRNATTPEKGVYIANIVKCRPPQNRNPQPNEGATCLPYLKRQIELVKPEAIILLGAVPLNFLLNKNGITRMRGTWLDYKGIPVMPTFHPAYLLRFERQRVKFIEEKHKVWGDLQMVMAKLGLKRPQ